MKYVDLGEPTSILDHVYFVVLNENVKQAKVLWITTEACSSQGFLPGLRKNSRNKSHGGT